MKNLLWEGDDFTIYPSIKSLCCIPETSMCQLYLNRKALQPQIIYKNTFLIILNNNYECGFWSQIVLSSNPDLTSPRVWLGQPNLELCLAVLIHKMSNPYLRELPRRFNKMIYISSKYVNVSHYYSFILTRISISFWKCSFYGYFSKHAPVPTHCSK